MIKFIHSFYCKLAMSIVASFILIGVLLLGLAERLTHTYQQEVQQKLHLDLAQHVTADDALLKNGQIDQHALKQAFHNMMILGPSFEFYILDPAGKVTTYSAAPGKVKRERVNLQSVKELLAYSHHPNIRSNPDGLIDHLDHSFDVSPLPILGDDPRSPAGKKIFSAAPIVDGDRLVGYLYIIIGGEIYDNIVELMQKSHIVQLSFWGFVAVLTFGLIVMLLLFGRLTRPLHRLTTDIRNFQRQGFSSDGLDLHDWHKASSDEITRLGVAFREMASELKHQYRKVKDTDELRRELISYVSHDLRTPLASLQGYLETWLMRRPQLSEEESTRMIGTALKNAEQINRLIDQLFELAHLEGDSVAIHKEPVAIAELAQDVFHHLHIDPDCVIQLEVSPKDPSLMVLADIEKIERVLTNLLNNAVRHCDCGGMVRVEFEPVDAKHLRVIVADTGCGIPPDDLPHIFDPHYRASNSVKGKARNSGLGLAITRRIVELHGSEVAVESELNKGTRFSFVLETP
ncbi:Sensor histidine kinase ResE [BD1-7 clade bacterium]|uniref:histidine kinase n=1 Tax=BD1-7 clade bacterium TaxID=2029982 RepID=A0A5S9N533_9GAMM|nr:Sensor histidine kinase ResE [BD1-7 clade bacterium]